MSDKKRPSVHRVEKRQCPVCLKPKEYQARFEACSMECGHELRRRRIQARKLEEEKITAMSAAIPHDPTAEAIKDLLRKAKDKGGVSLRELSEKVDRSEVSVKQVIDALVEQGYNVHIREDGQAQLSGDVRPGGEPPIVHPLSDFTKGWRAFGACGDNHLGSKHERLDVLNAIYDVYAAEGVREVYNTGNWIEGESSFNQHDIKIWGMDNQIDYWIENYPRRPGITTYFIAGPDHEGWWQARENIVIGKHAMLAAQAAGRDDLVYLGYMEADIELKAKNGSRMMKVIHPGGGSSYALSYSMQKWVEALQGGEKPAVVLAGHYHKFDFNYYREVLIVQTGCTQDQSIFMRKLKLQAHVGGCLIRMSQADDGRITRFQVEWMPFYDRGWYEKRRNFGQVQPMLAG